MNFSTTQASNISAFVGLAVLVLNHFKINITSDELEQGIGAGIVLVSLIVSFVNRFKKGDITIAGFKKPTF